MTWFLGALAAGLFFEVCRLAYRLHNLRRASLAVAAQCVEIEAECGRLEATIELLRMRLLRDTVRVKQEEPANHFPLR